MSCLKLHPVYFIACLSTGILIGVGLSSAQLFQQFSHLSWLIVAVIPILFSIILRYKWLLIFILIGGIFFGLWRGSNEKIALGQYQTFYGHEVTISGKVFSDATINTAGKPGAAMSNIYIENQKLSGKIWVTFPPKTEVKRGDQLVLHGKLDDGFGVYPGSIYKAKLLGKDKSASKDVGRVARDWFSEKITKAISQPQSSLGISFVMGHSQFLNEDLSKELRLLGLIHLAVASGYHLSLVIRFIRRPLSGVSKYLAVVSCLSLIFGFLLISGFNTSMVRAALVSGLSLIAWYYGRKIHPMILLLFVAALTVIINPGYMWGDVGWYLSFASFWGVIILAPLINNFFWGSEKEPGFFRYLIVATFSAQLATLPIIAITFGQYSPLSMASNLLIQPLVPLAMLFTFVAGVFAAVFPPLAIISGWPAQLVLTYMTKTTSWMSGLPWASGELKFSISDLIVFYVAVILITLFLFKKTRLKLNEQNIV